MKKEMQIPQDLNQFREELDGILSVLSAKYGMDFEIGRMTYFPDGFRFKVEAAREGAESPIAVAWKEYAEMYDLPVEALGKTFRSRGKVFTVTGLDTKKRKYPVMANDEKGSGYKFPVEQFNRLYALSNPIETVKSKPKVKVSAKEIMVLCPDCKGSGKINLKVTENGKTEDTKITCVVCEGNGSVPQSVSKAFREEQDMWCKCGNPSGDVNSYKDGEHPNCSKHCYTCKDCEGIVQIG